MGKIRLETFAEVDHARFLLNFRRIELGLFRTGRWEVFYRTPCRFLDAPEARCRIHDRPEQPRICRYYNPYRCWYKAALTGGTPADFLRVDRQRLEVLLPRLVFNAEGRLVDVPGWSDLTGLWKSYPLPELSCGDGADGDPVEGAWPDMKSAEDGKSASSGTVTYAELENPCTGCGAWCCRALMLSHITPASATSLDFLRFVLGFPGVTLGLSEDAWKIVVRTECRHLARGRCELYGQEERPLECRYLDAWGCESRLKLGGQRSPKFLEIALDSFPRMVEPFRFDPTGRITRQPSFRELQSHLEATPRRPAPSRRKGGPGHHP